MSNTNKKIINIKKWLNFIESWPLVSGHEWTDYVQTLWLQKFREENIDACFDTVGNILIGAKSEHKWYESMLKQSNSIIFQAHLDHPGSIILNNIGKNNQQYRYMAVLQGSFIKNLEGRYFDVYNIQGEMIDRVMIDHEDNRLEKCVSFKTEKELPLPAYLIPPRNNAENKTKFDLITGWGLDDHLGCAMVLALLQEKLESSFFGLLTVNEETGGNGIRYIMQELIRRNIKNDKCPLLINYEVTKEYPDSQHVMGAGACWRTQDSLAEMNKEILNVLKKKYNSRTVALTEGFCEAGVWAKTGAQALSLVIPCLFAHNGRYINEWRAEEVRIGDVVSAVRETELLFKIVSNNLKKTEKVLFRKNNEMFVIKDHASTIRMLTKENGSYMDSLKNVIPEWNNIHSKYSLPQIIFSQTQWQEIRNWIIKTDEIAAAVIEKLPLCHAKVLNWLGVESEKKEAIEIHFFIMASYNAATAHYGIGISLDKVEAESIDRILIHELIHYYVNDKLRMLGLRKPYLDMLDEGFACLATMQILKLSARQALNLSETQYTNITNNTAIVKKHMMDWLMIDVMNVTIGRHEIVDQKNIPKPFKLSTDQQNYPKFGYYLGLTYLSKQYKKNMTINDWLTGKSKQWIEQNILEYLK